MTTKSDKNTIANGSTASGASCVFCDTTGNKWAYNIVWPEACCENLLPCGRCKLTGERCAYIFTTIDNTSDESTTTRSD